MLRLFSALILLGLPIAELIILINLGHRYGGWVLLYLVIIGYLGLRLIKEEKSLVMSRIAQNVLLTGNPMAAMQGAKNLFAGILLLIPGVITDAIAVVLLLLPDKTMQSANADIYEQAGVKVESPPPHRPTSYKTSNQHTQSSNDAVIEGEFTRED